MDDRLSLFHCHERPDGQTYNYGAMDVEKIDWSFGSYDTSGSLVFQTPANLAKVIGTNCTFSILVICLKILHQLG